MGTRADTSRTLDSWADMIAELSTITQLRRPKSEGNFHYKSRAFLHFHPSEEGLQADVKIDGEWVRLPVTNPAERAALVARVRTYVGA